MANVTLTNLTKVYARTVTAVDRINLEIYDKEFMVFVGPSGCGKSTTLRMIAGLEDITSGEVRIGDRVVNMVPPKNRDIAMVFQNYALYPHMSVYDNMAFGLKLRKRPKAEIKQAVTEAAETLGITDYLQRRPKELSGGQRQRVAVGRAIVRQPEVFLFDEPLSNLDAKMRVQMRTEIKRLHHKLETTMIYVTHDQVEAMTMGDRICVMKDGLIQQVDDPLTLYEKPANLFVASFIGTPPMNLFQGRLERKENVYLFTDGDVNFALPASWNEVAGRHIDKPVVFGIRPEDIGSKNVEGEDSLPKFRARVEVVEPMGAETNLNLRTEHATLIATVDPHLRPKVDEILELPIDINMAHLFDAKSENLII